MADIRADETGGRQTHLGIQIGAIHIDLATMRMNDVADFAYGFLKDPVC